MGQVRLECGHWVQAPDGLGAGQSYPCPICDVGAPVDDTTSYQQLLMERESASDGLFGAGGAHAMGIFAGPIATSGYDPTSAHQAARVTADQELAAAMKTFRQLAERNSGENDRVARLEALVDKLLAERASAPRQLGSRVLEATFDEDDDEEPEEKPARKKPPAKKAKAKKGKKR